MPFIEDKGDTDWPRVEKSRGLEHFREWVDKEAFVKLLSVTFYTDGEYGISFSFPFFVVKNLEDPMGGGFITHRMTLTDHSWRDFTWKGKGVFDIDTLRYVVEVGAGTW